MSLWGVRNFFCNVNAVAEMRKFTTAVTKMSQSIKNDKTALRKKIKVVLSRLREKEIEDQCS